MNILLTLSRCRSLSGCKDIFFYRIINADTKKIFYILALIMPIHKTYFDNTHWQCVNLYFISKTRINNALTYILY